jgi:hypothetical protein
MKGDRYSLVIVLSALLRLISSSLKKYSRHCFEAIGLSGAYFIQFPYVDHLQEKRQMSGCLSVSSGIYLQPPLLPVNVKRLTVLDLHVFAALIVQFVSVVDIIGV